jgi:hypothetical protein
MAEIFLHAFAKVILNVAPRRKAFMRKVAPSGIYEYVIARTQLFDEIFLEALDEGISPNSDPGGRYGYTSFAIFKQESRNQSD